VGHFEIANLEVAADGAESEPTARERAWINVGKNLFAVAPELSDAVSSDEADVVGMIGDEEDFLYLKSSAGNTCPYRQTY
jgi:hypothetical protein